jgi:hypothetical protein
LLLPGEGEVVLVPLMLVAAVAVVARVDLTVLLQEPMALVAEEVVVDIVLLAMVAEEDLES